MKSKSKRNVDLYIYSCSFVAALITAYAFHDISRDFSFLRLGICIALSIITGNLTINLSQGINRNEVASISIGFISTLLLIQSFGIKYGIISAVFSVSFDIIRQKQYKQYLFNTSCLIASAFTAWLVLRGFQLLHIDYSDIYKAAAVSPLGGILRIAISLLACQCYHFVNASLVTGVVSLSMSWNLSKAVHFFRTKALWVSQVYLFAGLFINVILWISNNILDNFAKVLPLALSISPLPVLFFFNLKLHTERDKEKERRMSELETLYSAMVQAMGRAIEAKDQYTQEHISRVVAMSIEIGRALRLSEMEIRSLEVGAALHDIGKIAIPEEILNKPGKLTVEEFEIVKQHAALGSDILQPVPFPPEVAGAVRHHHEKWDGTGYPDSLAGQHIPLFARIVAVADVYDALTSDRPYRRAWHHERTMLFLREQVGKHFDPEVFQAFEVAMANNPSLHSIAVAEDDTPAAEPVQKQAA